MRFILSTAKSINASYSDEAGVVQFKVHTPIRVHKLVTEIRRRLDGDIPQREQSGSDTETDASGRFGLLATLSWHIIGWKRVIQFGGTEISPETFLRKEKVGALNWEYVFTARDGKEYRWYFQMYSSTLKVNDVAATVVAEYKVSSVGVVSKPARPASLEISPEFEYMVDEIMVTFIYLETIRRSPVEPTQQL
ncbi:hypothetical protein C8F04DRAFT_1277668 [Mycena alexandri]|uniref:DUF6593 domain-containing protein n=1 Tax=Mycena alexandri TaxID=1745969 RepID=A0AAD6S3X1_9AGAR|nr:hypothetical protein C8F04DRAFT_1277668 [Mycena alexandri]